MSLATKTLSELARLNAGIGPVSSPQVVATDANLSSPVANANFGTFDPTTLEDGDGVDVSGATLVVVRVEPTGDGNVVFDVYSRTTGRTDQFEALNNLIGIDTSVPWKEIVFCGPEEEIVVVPTDGTATTAVISVDPCNG